MKLISETTVSRSRFGNDPEYANKVVQTNYGVERRYRTKYWDFLGLWDKKEIEWDEKWFTFSL